jgi:hypothetical protein
MNVPSDSRPTHMQCLIIDVKSIIIHIFYVNSGDQLTSAAVRLSRSRAAGQHLAHLGGIGLQSTRLLITEEQPHW